MEAGLTVQHSMANSVLSDEYKPQVKSVPVIPFWSTDLPQSNTSKLCWHLLPWPFFKSFLYFQLPPLLFISSSFLFCLFYVVLGGLELKTSFPVAEELFLSVCLIHFHFCSFTCTATSFSCACPIQYTIWDNVWQKELKNFLRYPFCMPPQFFIWDNVRPMDLQIFPKAPIYKRLEIVCDCLCNV